MIRELRRAACIAVGLTIAGSTSALAQKKPAAVASKLPDGKAIFTITCAACHRAGGEGLEGTYPPLAESEWVAGDEAKVVRIILHGLTGPVDVAGQTFNGAMPPWGATLKDAEIAAVATYVRSAWGNSAAPITAARVTAIRAATKSRKTPWTVAELALVPATKK